MPLSTKLYATHKLRITLLQNIFYGNLTEVIIFLSIATLGNNEFHVHFIISFNK